MAGQTRFATYEMVPGLHRQEPEGEKHRGFRPLSSEPRQHTPLQQRQPALEH